jgi:uncharacterized repeat protein (TIGR03803 family)
MRLRHLLSTLIALLMILLTLVPSSLAAPKYKVLHAFGRGQDGAGTWGSLLLDKSGNLYGTTGGGGLYGYGTAFELMPKSNSSWSETILHNFNRNGHTFIGSDGAQPDANLILDDKVNLYGTASTGGTGGEGVVFALTP